MSSSGISFGGLASGLDTKAIIAALMAVERRPITALEQKKTSFQKQKDLFGKFEDLLGKLKTAADVLRKADRFLDFKASVDVDKHLAATASTSAAPGSYDIVVNSLAKAETSTSLGKADKSTTTFGAGNLKFTVDGNDWLVGIDNTNNTLEGIAAAINATPGLKDAVHATVLDTGSGATPYKLVITGRQTGAENAITIAADDADPTLTALANELDANQTQAATDAVLTINNVQITRASNVISDAIAGVTLTLKGADPLATTKLTVATDVTKTAEKVKAFVDAYNAVVDFVVEQNKTDAKGLATNPLFGDSTLNLVRDQLRGIVGGSVDTGDAGVALLAQIGITADTKGKLTFNQAKFEEPLTTKEQYVKALFSHATGGIATRVHAAVDKHVDPVDGLLKTRKSGYDAKIKQATDQIARTEARLVTHEAALVRKFSALEQTLSRLQSQGGALGAIVSRTNATRR
jgi:flagellar hook-associated protein 2